MTVFVLGGGVAGIVAALGLTDRGENVVLLESRSWLGGRAFSSHDKVLGRGLDNGPHAMLGCYRAMRALLRRLGTTEMFQQDRSLVMRYRRVGGEVDCLRLSRLPVPLAMLPALLRLRLRWREKVSALRGMLGSLFGAPASWSVAEWLQRSGQSGEPDAMLWRPLCHAIMNVAPERASARSFLRTLREAFSGSAANAAFWLPRRPWSEVLGDPAATLLAAAGAEVCLGERIERLEWRGDRIANIVTGRGEHEVAAGDDVVAALPWFALRKLLPDSVPLVELQGAPIVTAFFEAEPGAGLPDEGPVVALVGGDPFHFVLRTAGAPAHQFALLSGGSRVFDGMSVQAIEELARAQMRRFYPRSEGITAARVRIRKEHQATFVAAPTGPAAEVSVARPAPGPLPLAADNLFVCGDWTDTGLPATLEGAARSAETMLKRRDAAGRG